MYNFAPYYLSSIQQGIQAAHSQVQLVLNNKDDINVEKWVHDPVTICLNGGNSAALNELREMLDGTDQTKPVNRTIKFSTFNEDYASLEGILTNIAVLVPARVYNAFNELVRDNTYKPRANSNAVVRFQSVQEFFDSVNSCTLESVNSAYNDYVKSYGELTPFEVLLADRLHKYRLAN